MSHRKTRRKQDAVAVEYELVHVRRRLGTFSPPLVPAYPSKGKTRANAHQRGLHVVADRKLLPTIHSLGRERKLSCR